MLVSALPIYIIYERPNSFYESAGWKIEIISRAVSYLILAVVFSFKEKKMYHHRIWDSGCC